MASTHKTRNDSAKLRYLRGISQDQKRGDGSSLPRHARSPGLRCSSSRPWRGRRRESGVGRLGLEPPHDPTPAPEGAGAVEWVDRRQLVWHFVPFCIVCVWHQLWGTFFVKFDKTLDGGGWVERSGEDIAGQCGAHRASKSLVFLVATFGWLPRRQWR
jgi:hypothetical protein